MTKFVRGLAFCLAILFMLSASAMTVAAPDAKGAPVDFQELLDEVNKERKALVDKGAIKVPNSYTPTDPAAVSALTEAEMSSLLRKNPVRQSVTKEEAAQDVDVFFRALKHAYGAYYYYGGDAVFTAAKEKALKALESAKKATVRVEDLEKYIRSALTFLDDGHFQIGSSANPVNNMPRADGFKPHMYFYGDQAFYKDGTGYFQSDADGKWYYQNDINTAGAKMEPTLLSTGEIVYGPVLIAPKGKKVSDGKITLKNGSKTKSVKVVWKESANYSAEAIQTPMFKTGQVSGVDYIVERSFQNSSPENVQELHKFVKSGTELRKKKPDVLIFDMRSNGGGESRYAREWIKSFSGKEHGTKLFHKVRGSILSNKANANNPVEWQKSGNGSGAVLPNNTKIIVLVDANAGSAGESLLLALRSMANVIVVGSNSAGYQLTGNNLDLALPSSGMYFSCGTFLSFAYYAEPTKVEGKGYEPDIWCNPATSLEAVINMLDYYNIA